jgi:hypothetical protein
MSYEAFKVIHLLSVLMLFAVLGGAAVHAINGGTRERNAARRLMAGLHGLAMLLILATGAGLLARLDLMRGGVPAWVWGMVALWLAAGVLLVLPARRPGLARPMLWAILPLMALGAACLGVYKPGG